MSGPRTLNGKIVLQVYLLDNSYKTLLIEPTSTVYVRMRLLALWADHGGRRCDGNGTQTSSTECPSV